MDKKQRCASGVLWIWNSSVSFTFTLFFHDMARASLWNTIWYIHLDIRLKIRLIFPIVNYLFLDSSILSSPAYGVYMSQLIRCSRTCNSYQDFLHRSVLLIRKLLSQGFIETRLRSTLKKCLGLYHHLTLPYRVSMTTMANDNSRPRYCCHEYVSFLDTT